MLQPDAGRYAGRHGGALSFSRGEDPGEVSGGELIAIERARPEVTMKKIRLSPKPMQRRLLIAIVTSAVFSGVFVGLILIGRHG